MSGNKFQDNYSERFRTAFENCPKQRCLWEGEDEIDLRAYDMSQRLKLSDIIVGDSKSVVADLGSAFGGMSYALKERGLKVVSTEIRRGFCKSYLKNVNEYNVIHCDSFHPPLKDVDALVSYMFLGLYLPEQLAKKNENISDVFEELSSSADTIYSVELKSEYSGWFEWRSLFGWKSFDQDEIRENLGKALPNWDVEFLGKFGQFVTTDGYTEDRFGFRFTRRKT